MTSSLKGTNRDLVGPFDMATSSDADAIVFVVDDDSDVREGLKGLLESAGIRCVAFQSTTEFLRVAKYERARCLILDVRMHGTDGRDLHKILSDAPITI